MKRKRVPEEVVNAINLLLTPYEITTTSDALIALKSDEIASFQSKEPRYVDMKTACAMYMTSRWTFFRAIKNDGLPVKKLSPARCGKLLLKPEDIEEWLRRKSEIASGNK